jgi:hypothetical protein
VFGNLNLTDMETCYKVFRWEVIADVTLKSNRFGFEPEFTAKIARKKWRIYEVPISYRRRTYEEGGNRLERWCVSILCDHSVQHL